MRADIGCGFWLTVNCIEQRSRRFRSAFDSKQKEEAESKLREQWAKEGKSSLLPKKKPPSFDRNVITPGPLAAHRLLFAASIAIAVSGTPFMARLSEYIMYYIQVKQKNDPGWKNVRASCRDKAARFISWC